ncbi:MAG: helix-turn-helix domain containing protein, partial [Planctomycetota bacterium]|nr:helix-turn-helix domain containing protein [Planctomycetota bacterium]
MSRISEVCQATWDAFRNTKDVVLKERLHAVLLSHDGRTRREIAEILFCEVSDFKPWLTIYKAEGL